MAVYLLWTEGLPLVAEAEQRGLEGRKFPGASLGDSG